MNTITQVNINGQMVNAIELFFEPLKEPWCEYELVDGGRVRCRTTVARIFWLVDEEGKGLRLPDGGASLWIQHLEQISSNF